MQNATTFEDLRRAVIEHTQRHSDDILKLRQALDTGLETVRKDAQAALQLALAATESNGEKKLAAVQAALAEQLREV
jgi:hypothetical protein